MLMMIHPPNVFTDWIAWEVWNGHLTRFALTHLWQHRSESTLAQVMACCLTASSHYLNQCLFIIKGVLWHHLKVISQEVLFNCIGSTWDYTFQIIATAPMGQLVNQALPTDIFLRLTLICLLGQNYQIWPQYCWVLDLIIVMSIITWYCLQYNWCLSHKQYFGWIRNLIKICSALVENVFYQSQWNFAHVTTVTLLLSWCVQNFIVNKMWARALRSFIEFRILSNYC